MRWSIVIIDSKLYFLNDVLKSSIKHIH